MNKNKKNKRNNQQQPKQQNQQPQKQQSKQQQFEQQPRQPQSEQPQELSYYGLLLLSFLKESHPERVNDSDFITTRSESAAEAYSEAVRSGSTHDAAAKIANRVLFSGLHFSRYDVIITVLWNEFSDEVPQGSAKTLALQLLPVCEKVFAKYPLSDNFRFEPSFDNLYTEITGTILIWLDENGIQ